MHCPDVGQLLACVFAKHGLDVMGFNNIACMSVTKLSLQMEQVASKTPPKIEAPKHGQVDPKNDPHIGVATLLEEQAGATLQALEVVVDPTISAQETLCTSCQMLKSPKYCCMSLRLDAKWGKTG
ncbi:hypothetical protein HDU80_000435 [Chytriomyces hyalinus]|nr:hypothetical protein HDU80_000435 [Chytriomyces hyalinus]